MIVKITPQGFDMSEELHKYARGKLDRLTRYIARKDRSTTLVDVVLTEKPGEQLMRTCQLSVKLRRQELTVRETTQHMYASLDVAVADMERQLHSYRALNPGAVRTRVQILRSRLRRQGRGQDPADPRKS